MAGQLVPIAVLFCAACGDGGAAVGDAGADAALDAASDGGGGDSSADAASEAPSDAADAAPAATNHLKLGIHELGATSDGPTVTLVSKCPRVVKWLSHGGNASNSEIATAMASYHSACAASTTVLRVYVDGSTHYAASDDPAKDAADFWQKMQVGLTGIPTSAVDWLEGPNELDNLPDWYHDLGAAQWFASFWSTLADTMNAAGYHPLVASVAVGNPALAGELGTNSPCAMTPLAQVIKAKKYRIGWSYHAYTPDAKQDATNEAYYSLRYRTIAQQSGLGGVPIVLTEGGEDAPGGWQGRTSPDVFLAWLRWFDGQMNADPDVVGESIFQVGNRGGWNAFDLGPIAGDLATYEASPAAGLTCKAYAKQEGWSSNHCETGGNAACSGAGVPSTDCVHCCP